MFYHVTANLGWYKANLIVEGMSMNKASKIAKEHLARIAKDYGILKINDFSIRHCNRLADGVIFADVEMVDYWPGA